MEEIELIKRKKQWLRRYRKNEAKIERLEEKINFIDARMEGVKGIRMSSEPKGSSHVSQAELLSDKMDIEERIKRLKIKSRQLKNEICNAIDTLENDKHVEVLESYFIDGLSFEEIAVKINRTTRRAIWLYSDAIEAINIDFNNLS